MFEYFFNFRDHYKCYCNCMVLEGHKFISSVISSATMHQSILHAAVTNFMFDHLIFRSFSIRSTVQKRYKDTPRNSKNTSLYRGYRYIETPDIAI